MLFISFSTGCTQLCALGQPDWAIIFLLWLWKCKWLVVESENGWDRSPQSKLFEWPSCNMEGLWKSKFKRVNFESVQFYSGVNVLFLMILLFRHLRTFALGSASFLVKKTLVSLQSVTRASESEGLQKAKSFLKNGEKWLTIPPSAGLAQSCSSPSFASFLPALFLHSFTSACLPSPPPPCPSLVLPPQI